MESRRVALMHGTGPRSLTSLYVAGPFSMGYVDFFTFLIPLYGLSLGLDVAEIGILVGARSILALFLSIHIGVLMDRFGTRAVTLVFDWVGMLLAPLFPLAASFWVLLLLQLVNGAAVSFAWSGAQTLIAQLAEGDPGYIGRFSFFARLRSTSAPIVAGAVWDLGGAWPARAGRRTELHRGHAKTSRFCMGQGTRREWLNFLGLHDEPSAGFPHGHTAAHLKARRWPLSLKCLVLVPARWISEPRTRGCD